MEKNGGASNGHQAGRRTMIKKCFVQCMVVAWTMSAAPAFAALPPAYQRAAELAAAIDAATKVLDGVPVVGVEYILEDVYRAYSDDCVVTVVINTIANESEQPMVGPRHFEAVADEPVCGTDQ